MAKGGGLVLLLVAIALMGGLGGGGPARVYGAGRNIRYQYQLSSKDPLARAEESDFESMKTGVTSIVTPYVRRKGVLKPISKIFEVSRRTGSPVFIR